MAGPTIPSLGAWNEGNMVGSDSPVGGNGGSPAKNLARKRIPSGNDVKHSGREGRWAPSPNDREKLKRSFISIFIEHPVITLLLVILIGVAVFGDVLN
jgi:hypothetical protein